MANYYPSQVRVEVLCFTTLLSASFVLWPFPRTRPSHTSGTLSSSVGLYILLVIESFFFFNQVVFNLFAFLRFSPYSKRGNFL